MANWVGVVSRDHAMQAVAGGFFQSNHGKEAPVARMARGDHVLFYSPKMQKNGGEPVQSFTAVGRVEDSEPKQVRQSETFHPFRRKVHWFDSHDAPIKPMLEDLEFTKGRSSWGMILRRGLFDISDHDYKIIARAMGTRASAPYPSPTHRRQCGRYVRRRLGVDDVERRTETLSETIQTHCVHFDILRPRPIRPRVFKPACYSRSSGMDRSALSASRTRWAISR